MATTANVTTAISVAGTYATDTDLEDAISKIRQVFSQQYTNGTGSGQANTVYLDTLTLTTSATTLDLTGGLTDRWGTTLTFSSVREIIVVNQSSTLKAYLAGNFMKALAQGTTIVWDVYPGGAFVSRMPLGSVGATYGFPITAGNDTITLTAESGSVEVDVLLVGTR